MRNSTIIIIEAPRLRYLFHPDSNKPRYTAKPAAGIKASGTIHPAGMLIRAARGCSLPEIAAPPAKDIRHKQKIPIHVQDSGRNMSYSHVFFLCRSRISSALLARVSVKSSWDFRTSASHIFAAVICMFSRQASEDSLIL